ncbi:MAG: hypothetical protein WC756_09570 [Taibaiella sp.]|jgi:hypothetical protein
MKYIFIFCLILSTYASYGEADTTFSYDKISKSGIVPLPKSDVDRAKAQKSCIVTFNNIPKGKEEIVLRINSDPKDVPVKSVVMSIEKIVRESKQVNDGSYTVTFQLGSLIAQRERDTFHFLIDGGKKEIVKYILVYKKGDNTGDKAATPAKEGPDLVDYWSYLDTSFVLNLERFRIKPKDNCYDTCRQCDYDSLLKDNNVIEYDALTRRTSFRASDTPKTTKPKPLKWNYRAKLKAGDPVVLVVKNANPLNQEIKFYDSAYLYNIDIPSALSTALHIESVGSKMLVQSTGDEEKLLNIYLLIRSRLLMLGGEMEGLLNSYVNASPYQYACLQEKMGKATAAIETFVQEYVVRAFNPTASMSFDGLLGVFGASQQAGDSILATKLQYMYNLLRQSKPVIAYPVLQIPEVDEMKFYLEILPKKDSPYPPLLSSKNPITLNVTHFFKVDVSSGLYLGFKNDHDYGYLSRNDTVFTPSQVGADSVLRVRKQLVDEEPGKLEFGFASFIHFYYKLSPVINAGLIIGAGVSFAEPVRTRYFAGLSCMLGNKNRVCINGGLMFGNYQQLSRQYEQEGDKYYAPLTETNIAYKKRFGHTGFLSVSYNLFSLRTKQSGTAADKTP